jgi:ATP-dependent RNA helicase DeaD
MTLETESAPPPTFDALPLSSELRRAIDDLGYVHPTPVQRAVFEPASRGRDLVVQARTGTGKTAAFGLPLIDVVVRRKEARVQALALCPTRELALQVTREITALAKYRGTKIVAVYGGAPMPKQIEQIRDGAQILVGTPGRVLDHLSRGTLDASSIRAVVLDESDEMLSMGFLPQINDIFSYLPETRQTLLFSATLPSDIKRMAEKRMVNPEFITLSGDHIGALEIRHFVYLSRGDKLSELVQVLENENPESAVVFCNTRDETKRVAAAISQQGFTAEWLNADLAQNERERVMEATRQGKLRFLVATDVAARGIDISHLTHVINFDFPDTAESYVHRTGRTGRAGRTGTAISLIEPSDIGNLYLLRLTYKLKPIERQLPSATELRTRAETDLVRWFVDGFGKRPVHADDLALARRLLSHEQGDHVIAALLREHLGARPDAQDDATAARRAGSPKPAPSPAVVLPAPTVAKAAPSAAESRSATAPVNRSRRTVPERAATVPDRAAATVPERAAATVLAAPAELAPELIVVEKLVSPAPQAHRPAGSANPDTEVQSPLEGEPEDVELGEDVVELYASVGRRHGAKPSDYERILEARGVPANAIAYVRVRHRNAFVAVRREELDRVLEALEGASVAGRIVRVEPSRGAAPRGGDDTENDEAV